MLVPLAGYCGRVMDGRAGDKEYIMRRGEDTGPGLEGL